MSNRAFGWLAATLAALMMVACGDASLTAKPVAETVTVTITVTATGSGAGGKGGAGGDENVGGHDGHAGAGGGTTSTTKTGEVGKGGGGSGGSPTTTTETGTGGAGGAATTTSSTSTTTTTSSTSSTSTSTSSTTSTTTTTSTSTVTGGPQKVTLHVYDIPPTAGNHAFNLFAFLAPDDPSIQWLDKPNWTANGAALQIDATVSENTLMYYGIAVDPPAGSNPSQGAYWANQACDPGQLKLTHNAYATVTINGATYPAPPIQVKPNGNGGCWLMVAAMKSPFIAPNDEDGDGYTTDNPVKALRDCADQNGEVHPGAVETPATVDQLDADCDGAPNPTRDIVIMKIGFSDLHPQVNSTNGSVYPMTWDAGNQWYVTNPIERISANVPNPKEFYVSWPKNADPYPYCVANTTCYDSSYYSGSCHADLMTMQMGKEGSKVFTPLTLQIVNASTCHWFSQ